MTDVYAWIDPFEEVVRANRAERQAAYAFDEGKRAVLSYIGSDYKGDFSKALNHAIGAIARQFAEETVKPHMAKHFDEYQMRERLVNARIDALNAIAKPLAIHTIQDGLLTLELPQAGSTYEDMTVSYETIQPFRYTVAMSPMMWR